MKTTVLNYFDDRRQAVADLSLPNIKRFADENGYDHIVEYSPSYPRPYMRKVEILQKYLPECDRLIYCDVDVLFHQDARGEPLFVSGLNVSCDYGGLCAGFLALQNVPAVNKVLRVWNDLGRMIHAKQHDQDTLQMLVHSFKWVKDITYFIPQRDVANPHYGPRSLIAHHFWCQFNVEDCLQRMRAFVP